MSDVTDRSDFAWQSLALCVGLPKPRKANGDADDPLFDSYEESEDEARAVDAMCSVCPVRRVCLIEGIENKEQGVRGGFYLINGKPDKARNGHKTEEQWSELRELLS